MWRVLILVLGGIFGCGCGAYAGAQRELVSQARAGLKLVEEARASNAQALEKYLADRRARLDAAFERDLNNRANIEKAWVLEAARAYGVGVEQITLARERQAKADEVGADNAAAAEEALVLLERMLKTQEKINVVTFWEK